MSEKFDAELLSKFLDQLQKMIDLREEMIKWLQDFIEVLLLRLATLLPTR
mgnify:CR=1 FL=1